ncbi:MAG: 3',5'-cyclic-nucleotide phosphodiesterase [Sandaracinaceae bacterium]|nr:3',5'-cyclic-nucleotide phosphodiesterase [Sandaracinaceae bacterium]
MSHAHLDHVRDLATLADHRCQQGGQPLVIAGLPETIRALQQHFFNNILWPDFSKIPLLGQASQGMTIVFKAIEAEKWASLSCIEVMPVRVNHTIDACGFIVRSKGCSIVYSGDTGPTDRLWECASHEADLRAILLEVSFPNHMHGLAHRSGHHIPETLGMELKKLERLGNGSRAPLGKIPVFAYHIKPLFEQRVERELAMLRESRLEILRLDARFVL